MTPREFYGAVGCLRRQGRQVYSHGVVLAGTRCIVLWRVLFVIVCRLFENLLFDLIIRCHEEPRLKLIGILTFIIIINNMNILNSRIGEG